MESEEYTSLILNLQRPINCLVDPDRNIRRSGLDTLNRELFKSPKDIQLRVFLNTNLGKNLVHTLNDLIQINREITLNIFEKLFTASEFKRQESEVFIQALISRLNAHPFPEKSEDLRLKIVKLLKICLQFKEGIVSNMAELTSALTKCLSDPDSNIKNSACDLINDLSTSLKNVVGKYSIGLTKALSENLKHNKFQVRKTTLGTISKLLVTEGAGGNFEHVQLGLKVLLSDSKAQVRKTALECIAYLIKYMAPKYLKQHQANLVSFLLIGLSDEAVQNVNLCIKLMQECGQSIKQLYEGQEEMIAQ